MQTGTKRVLILGLFSLLLISFIGFVAAQTTAEEAGAAISTEVINFVNGFLNPIQAQMGDLYGNGNNFATRILFGILLFMILWEIVDLMFHGFNNTTGGKVTSAIGALIITLLTFIALPPNFLEGLLVSYGAMGATILSVIPFLIVLLFSVRVGSLLVAKICWTFYFIYYFGLYIYAISTATTWTSSTPYIVGAVAGIIMLFTVGEMRKWMFHLKINELEEAGKQVADRARLLNKIEKGRLEAETA